MTTGTAIGALKRARSGVGNAGPGRSANNSKRRFSHSRIFFLFLLPSLILVILLNLYPVIYAGIQSLSNGDLLSAGEFVGLANYIAVLQSPEFWHAAIFTVVFTIVGVFGSWIVGISLALLLRTRIPANGVFKVLLLLPWVVPIVVSAMSWNWLVATPQSPLPMLAQALGFGNVLFLANPFLAQITVCVFKVWISFPFMMMMMASALTSVDVNVYEASKVDGATAVQTFTRITLPMIARTTYISWILMTIFCVNDFPSIFLLTGGGPVNSTQTLVVLAYTTVFQNFQTGPGVAIAFMMTIVLVIISTLLYRQIRKVNIE
ncbi:carbohydrate ABC transporter permease [Subtercola vilae]|uniref:Sugar ABC transporter permease n=1 Tax=Subtercola vilae TaxID=2056433 RepID=A0A4T2BVR7_9MICO|nr:sugar ABC transporter permease [Subtercola vilae]TIH33876.1 sugar ABC transporter permease [Subtercola vilae]